MFAYDDGSVAQLTSVWHQVLSRESSRRLEVFCEKAVLWTDDDYLGPLHVQTDDGTREITAPLPEWAGRLTVPEVFAKSDRALRGAGEGVSRPAFGPRPAGGAGRRSRGWSGRSVGSRGARRTPPRRPGISLGRPGGVPVPADAAR